MSDHTQSSTGEHADVREHKVSSKKETVLYGRVTKKKQSENIRYKERIYRNVYDYKEAFKSAFDFSGIGMALMSTDGYLLDANNAFCNFTGYSRAELLQTSFLQLGHPDDNETDRIMLHRMLTNLINYYSHEKRYISRSKRVLWGMHTVSKVYNKNGSLEFYVLQVVDINRSKELTGELNRKNSELEAIRTGLINKISQLEDLNHIVAHNLRGPANNIVMLIEMLREKFQNKDSSGMRLEISEIISYLEEGGNSLVSSLTTLMDVVQISMNKDIPFADCDVHAITGVILDQLNSLIYEKGAFVQLDMAVHVISYPKVFLESIIYNLVSNALKYTNTDRIPEILIRTYMAGGKPVISVKDNGLGIDLVKYGSRLFKLNQVFHQGQGIDSKGIGLYITRAQVESFGGKIEVKSRENEGSEFIVTL